jgi:prepilin-type N-terminal cleavage/methylation domain-containing protein
MSRAAPSALPWRARAPRRSGFSLLELLIVLSMMSLIGMMAIGRTSSLMTQWRLTRAAQAYGEELQSAFALVGRSRKPMTITLDKVKMEVRVSDRNGVVYRRRNIGTTSAYKLDPADVTASRLVLEVFPPGLAADSMSVEFSRQGKYRRVRLLRGGLVQVCSNHASLNGVCVPA